MTPFRQRSDDGMTLPELLVAMVIVGIIMSAVASAVIMSLSAAPSAADDQLNQSHDAQLLSYWMITDLQSVTSGGIDTNAGTATGCPGSPADNNNVLRLTWTDLSGPTTYFADYRKETVGGQFTLERFYCVAGQTPTAFVVVHNLSPTVAPVVTPSGKSVTLTVTTVGPNTQQPYTFSVSGGGRVSNPVAPILESATSMDTNRNGEVDEIVVQFNRTLTGCSNPNCTSDWTITGQPGASGSVHPTQVSVGPGSDGANDLVTLKLAELPYIDTVASSMKVAAVADTNGVHSVTGSAVVISSPQSVSDGMAPVLCVSTSAGTGTAVSQTAGDACSGTTAPMSKDSNTDGKLDDIDLTFSEPIATGSFTSAPWALSSASPSGATVDGTNITSSSNVLHLGISESSEVVDTAATGMQIALAASPGGVTDGSGNAAAFGSTTAPVSGAAVADGMAPVLMSLSLSDTSNPATPGIIDSNDSLVFTYSEPVSGTPTTSSLSVSGNNQKNKTETFVVQNLVTIVATNGANGSYFSGAGPLTATLTCTAPAANGTGNEVSFTCKVGAVTTNNAQAGPSMGSASPIYTNSPSGITDAAAHQATVLPTLPSGTYF